MTPSPGSAVLFGRRPDRAGAVVRCRGMMAETAGGAQVPIRRRVPSRIPEIPSQRRNGPAQRQKPARTGESGVREIPAQSGNGGDCGRVQIGTPRTFRDRSGPATAYSSAPCRNSPWTLPTLPDADRRLPLSGTYAKQAVSDRSCAEVRWVFTIHRHIGGEGIPASAWSDWQTRGPTLPTPTRDPGADHRSTRTVRRTVPAPPDRALRRGGPCRPTARPRTSLFPAGYPGPGGPT